MLLRLLLLLNYIGDDAAPLNLFQTVTENYQCEIQTLGYPKAALFSFCLALVTYNILATVRAVLASVHGVGQIDAGLSDYYMVDEIQGTYRGMMIAIPQGKNLHKTNASRQQRLLVGIERSLKTAGVSFVRFQRTPENWSIFADFSLSELASVLQYLAAQVSWSSFLKQPRAPKMKLDPPQYDPRHPHVSTAKLLAKAKKSP